MATLTTIKAKIKTILETKEGSGQPLNEVYGYWEVQPDKFPCAILEILDAEEKRLTTAENEVTANFKIRIAIRDTNNQTESDLRLSLIDTIQALFRTSPYVDTLQSEVQRVDLSKAIAFNSSEDMGYAGFDIILTVLFIKSLT